MLQFGQGEAGIEMGVLQDGHGRVGADEEESRWLNVCLATARFDIGVGLSLEEEAIARDTCNVVLKLAIVIYT